MSKLTIILAILNLIEKVLNYAASKADRIITGPIKTNPNKGKKIEDTDKKFLDDVADKYGLDKPE